MKRSEVLREAEKCVCGNREDDYGNPEDNFANISILWTDWLRIRFGAYKHVLLNAEDVAIMMVLLKIARIGSGIYKADNYVDGAGYLACASEIAGKNAGEE